MGADLYIRKIYKENHDKIQPLFDAAVKHRDKTVKNIECKGYITRSVFDFFNFKPEPFSEEKYPIVPEGTSIPIVGSSTPSGTRKINWDGKQVPSLSADEIKLYNENATAVNEVHDLYNKLYEKGYFRDSYNSSSLFWILNLSWWADTKELKLVNKQGNMSVRNSKRLLKIVQGKTIPRLNKTWPGKHHCSGTAEEWQKYFEEKKVLFENFLKEAINANQVIECSL